MNKDIEKRAAQRVNTIFLLVDGIETAAMEAESLLKQRGLFRYEVKEELNRLKAAAKKLVRMADRWDPSQAEYFGEAAEGLLGVVYEYLGVENADGNKI